MNNLNLIEVLANERHSGLLEGNCRIDFYGDFLGARDFFERSDCNLPIKITFSHGIKPLGIFDVQIETPFYERKKHPADRIRGHIVLDSQEKEEYNLKSIAIFINTDIDAVTNFCKFKAVINI